MFIMSACTDEWMNDWVNEWLSECTNEWMYEWVNEWKSKKKAWRRKCLEKINRKTTKQACKTSRNPWEERSRALSITHACVATPLSIAVSAFAASVCVVSSSSARCAAAATTWSSPHGGGRADTRRARCTRPHTAERWESIVVWCSLVARGRMRWRGMGWIGVMNSDMENDWWK